MREWFAFDEGGRSGSGGWQHLRTNWPHSREEPDRNHAVAMPHGWAIAEIWLLIRDCLVVEQGGVLQLLAGADPGWFTCSEGMQVDQLPTTFGPCSFQYTGNAAGATLTLTGQATPTIGFVVSLPPHLQATAICDGEQVKVNEHGRCLVPPHARRIEFAFAAAR